MNSLISNGIVDTYAPLVDIKGSYTAQFEHVSSEFPYLLPELDSQYMPLNKLDGLIKITRPSSWVPMAKKLSVEAMTIDRSYNYQGS